MADKKDVAEKLSTFKINIPDAPVSNSTSTISHADEVLKMMRGGNGISVFECVDLQFKDKADYSEPQRRFCRTKILQKLHKRVLPGHKAVSLSNKGNQIYFQIPEDKVDEFESEGTAKGHTVKIN